MTDVSVDRGVSPDVRPRGIIGIPNLLFGGDYYPEQWPEDVWREDAELMRSAGVNLASVGIFAWSRLEPEPGVFDFAWLDRIIDLLHEHGVRVDLATPTASPPPWLVRLHPEMLPVTAEGLILWHGARRHYCPHSAAYRDRAARLVSALAGRYGSHPALAMWHVDNEYACYFSECFCAASTAAFRGWLRERYVTLDALNTAWGTAFWSQHYGEWDEIYPPRLAPTDVNPTQQLDWRRFTSDSWIDCFDEQAAILRKATPGLAVTTNFMGFHQPIDYWKLAAHEDVVSNDSYPDTSDPEWMIDSSMTCDLIRSLGGGRPWMLMEQATAQVNWRPRNATKRPGIMRLGSYQAIARGADAVLFFQWRASRAGAEKFHSAMVPHGGTETRAWREVTALGQELQNLDDLVDTRVEAEAAILLDWENWWALEAPGKPSDAVRLIPRLRQHYAALFRRGTTVDFAHPAADLSRYRLVIAPSLYLIDDAAVANLERFVDGGGTLVVGFFSGIVDPADHIRPGPYPTALRDLLGLHVEEIVPLQATETNRIRTTDGGEYRCDTWAEQLRLDGAEALATFADDFYAGGPALTRHRVGRGTAYYVATSLDRAGQTWLTDLVADASGIAAADPVDGVEAIVRSDRASRWRFFLNHSTDEVEIALSEPGQEALSGARVEGSVRVGPRDLAIVRSPLSNATGAPPPLVG
jgi:beta-galactosidase